MVHLIGREESVVCMVLKARFSKEKSERIGYDFPSLWGKNITVEDDEPEVYALI